MRLSPATLRFGAIVMGQQGISGFALLRQNSSPSARNFRYARNVGKIHTILSEYTHVHHTSVHTHPAARPPSRGCLAFSKRVASLVLQGAHWSKPFCLGVPRATIIEITASTQPLI